MNGSIQVDRLAGERAQNASGSASASAYSAAWALAWAVNAGSGGKVRPSARRFSISGRWSTLTWASPAGMVRDEQRVVAGLGPAILRGGLEPVRDGPARRCPADHVEACAPCARR